ncbi:D-alanyl-D-alanine carboxypeptidase family protein [Scatolibacter rhodanostii]|uniref:D-alanyl-D-alanine carboxypeptidase family protein n=1 Tax=Scatolibacter rhodanostii TaxID=2014781 RepID=UPI000C081010|nr:D-alanyl-D-alanine carboxypeptidase family protein [Scatolibacter rhodanostii]
MLKKISSLLLALTITLSTFALKASAEGFPYTFNDGAPHSKSILMLNVDTDSVVYANNPDEQLSIASLTKIMTYIVAYENIPDIETTVITIPQSVADDLANTGSSLAKIEVGEELTGLQLLNLMMIPSGNDAALSLAKYVDGLQLTPTSLGIENAENPDTPLTFVDLMNRKAKELGCENTHFVNPHGLYDPEHYSTARDMMKIVQYARSLPKFTQITGQTYYELPPTNMRSEPLTVYTTNRLLLQNGDPDYYYPYATGIKTGSLDQSGYCLASSAVYEGYTYLIVALGSPYIDANGEHIEEQGEMLDSYELYKWAFTQLQLKTVATTGQLMADVELNYAWRKNRIQLVAGEDVTVILPNEVEISSMITTLDIPDSVDAPVKKGDIVGTATLSYADEKVATVSLVAAESVERSDVMLTLEQGKSIFTSGWFKLLAGGILLLIIIYIILTIVHNKRRKQRTSVRRYRDM